MVGITYTNTAGQTHSFNASSPSDALTRLGRLPGYAKTHMDDVGIQASKILSAKEARKKRAKDFASRDGSFAGAPSTFKPGIGGSINIPIASFGTSGEGAVGSLNTTNLRIVDGKIVGTTTRKTSGIKATVAPTKDEYEKKWANWDSNYLSVGNTSGTYVKGT